MHASECAAQCVRAYFLRALVRVVCTRVSVPKICFTYRCPCIDISSFPVFSLPACVEERERAFLLIGKYRNARNIEHLDGQRAPPQRSSRRTKRCTARKSSGARFRGGGEGERTGGVLVWVWRRFFRRQASTAPAVLVKRIRRLSRDWE